jgi:hypothetical protein
VRFLARLRVLSAGDPRRFFRADVLGARFMVARFLDARFVDARFAAARLGLALRLLMIHLPGLRSRSARMVSRIVRARRDSAARPFDGPGTVCYGGGANRFSGSSRTSSGRWQWRKKRTIRKRV